MDDPGTTILTCLSPDPHEKDIKDHILHYLGCVEISERNKFLMASTRVQSDKDITPTTTPTQPDENQQNRQKEEWRENCLSELRRIAFLRSKLEEDEEEKHLVENIKNSRKAWEESPEFKLGIAEIKNWRNSPEGISHGEQAHKKLEEPYDPTRDVNVSIMLFKKRADSSPAYEPDNEKTDPENAIWGKFPNQKTNVQRLLFDVREANLLDGGGDDNRIRYFHIPSNNMRWAEEAISRYYREGRPNFHPIQRDGKAVNISKAAWILKESHWRGQLHRGRAAISSRYMQPFCESIQSLDDATHSPGADGPAQNIVLFMPYMHWETSRNQRKFSQIIENIVESKNRLTRRIQEDDRKRRQLGRASLRRPTRPIPTRSGDLFNANSATKLGNEITSNIHEYREPQTSSRPIRSIPELLRASALTQNLKPPGNYPRLDQRGRVDLDSWLENQGSSQKQHARLNPSNRNPPSPRYRLGQYLLDAARLFEGMANYRDRKLLETYLMEDPPMHARRTLNQAYYWDINNIHHRDLNQVVYRATTVDPLKFHRWIVDRSIWAGHDDEDGMTPYELERLGHKPCSECTSNIQKVSRVVMVDQLWMWVLDKKTIITCFPERYGADRYDTSDIHTSIRMRIDEGGVRIHSVFDLALVIFEECSNTFDRTRNVDKRPQVLDDFSEAIGNIMHQQTEAFERLWRWTERASKMYRGLPRARVLSQLPNPLLDINSDGKLEKEVKDVLQELSMMSYIAKSEKDVLRSLVDNALQILKTEDTDEKGYESQAGTSSPAKDRKSLPRSSEVEEARAARAAYEWFNSNALEAFKRVDQRIGKLEELERRAKSTAEMVKDLLELKQEQAGMVQAWQSVAYNNEASRQGRSIVVFTIVTIVFLPLSFMSSVFGMNAIELGGNDNVMHLRDQFTYIFLISLGVVIFVMILPRLLSITAPFRTLISCIFKQSCTKVVIWTGLYRHIYYLKMGFMPIDTQGVYDNAVKKTESLKATEKQKLIARRRERRLEEEMKKYSLADADEDGPSLKVDGWTGWARSMFRSRSAHGSANSVQGEIVRV